MPAAKTKRSSGDDKTNVRDVASSFVGRSGDLAALADRVAQSRLVTVVGPGGMGKTRLATRFAADSVRAYGAHGGAGVWFCDCTEAQSVAGITAALAAALGVRIGKGTAEASMVDDLGATLERKGRVLVLLDNFEHLVAHAGATVGAWLKRAPAARFLVTSRVALDLPGEDLWPLGPLSAADAAELFVGRARGVRPDLEWGSRAMAVVAEVVSALDGMPLAIELAASRVSVLSPAELLERLKRPLDVLARPRDAGRHTSVRRTVLDSVAMLTPRERDVFAACAVFKDGFTLEAVEAVLGGADALAAIDALVRHSLLRARARRRQEEAAGEARFSFFETIREVAAERLAEHPARAALAERHARFYTQRVATLGAEAEVHSGGEAFGRLGLELENAIVAHAHAVRAAEEDSDGPGAHRAIAIALGLEPLLSARGLSRLRIGLLDLALASARRSRAPDPGEVAQTLLARGLARRELGETRPARADFEEAESFAQRAGRPELLALAHVRIGEVIEVAGDTLAAHERFARALTLLGQAPDGARRALREAEVYMRVGHAHRREGRLPSAEQALDQAIARYRRLAHDEGLAAALYEAAVVAMFQGRRDVSLARFDEGLVVATRADARAVAGALTTARGGLLQEMGALDLALEHHAEAAQVFREIGSRYRETSALYYLATAYLERGEPSEADKFLLQAQGKVEGVGSPRYEALLHGARALALAERGDAAASGAALEAATHAQGRCSTEPALASTLAIHALCCAALLSCAPRPAGARGSAGEDVIAKGRALALEGPSDDSRFALRMLLSVTSPVPPRPAVALVVWVQGRAFRLPRARASERVDLSRRPPLGRILHALATKRSEAPGEPFPVEEVVRAGWPGEKMAAHAALNRARVALATLRKLGLRDLLVTGAGGYWLNPAVPVRFAAEGEE